MQVVQIVHNPNAGDGEYSKKELITLVEEAGYEVAYASTAKENWKSFDYEKADFILVAGGDGAVRKVCKALLEKKYQNNPKPIAILPAGTANNLSKTICLEKNPEKLINSFKTAPIMDFGTGKLDGVEDEHFFMESFGYGIFPYLMMEMKKRPEEEKADNKLRTALHVLHYLILDYPARHCKLNIDGVDHSGDYIMAEVMNIRSIGPNLFISPNADPTDGVFEIVLVAADKKEEFASYIRRSMEDEKETFEFISFKGKHITMQWEGSHVHVDDKLIKLKENKKVTIDIEPGTFKFVLANE